MVVIQLVELQINTFLSFSLSLSLMSCRRKIISMPAMNEAGEKISPWITPLSMLNGSDIAINQDANQL